MLRCVLWGTGKVLCNNVNLIKCFELKKVIQVVGITSNEDYEGLTVFGYSWKSKRRIIELNPDIIIVMTGRKVYGEICSEISELGIGEDKVISYEVLQKSDMDLIKYLELKRNPPTIFTHFCWGSLTYNSLCFPFTSPFINIWITVDDYITLLKTPKYYMEQPLRLEGYGEEPSLQKCYPICKIGNVTLHCIHNTDYEEVKQEWERRKKRINWDNLFVMMATNSKEKAEEFIKLPYEKKYALCHLKCRRNSSIK